MALDPVTYDKLVRFCAYRERCASEVREKMHSLAVENKELYLKELKEDDMLNENRYAHAFAQGRFRIKYWGKHKIRAHMRQKGLAISLINEAIQSLDDEEYLEKIKELIVHKARQVKGKNDYERRVKIQRYLMQKGYESALVMECLSEMNVSSEKPNG